jgi:hypothetical protein
VKIQSRQESIGFSLSSDVKNCNIRSWRMNIKRGKLPGSFVADMSL